MDNRRQNQNLRRKNYELRSAIERIQKDINLHNAKFGKWEQVKRFELTPDVWSIDAGHLTPTMKMKRKIIKGKYISLYNKIYEKN